MATKADKGKERYWRRMIRERKALGVTVATFCQQRGISVHQYYWWQRQLRQRDGAVAVRQATRADAFVAVKVAVCTPPIELVHTSGCVIRVATGFDPDTLRGILATLGPREV